MPGDAWTIVFHVDLHQLALYIHIGGDDDLAVAAIHGQSLFGVDQQVHEHLFQQATIPANIRHVILQIDLDRQARSVPRFLKATTRPAHNFCKGQRFLFNVLLTSHCEE